MSADSEKTRLWGECEAQNQQLREELERVKEEMEEREFIIKRKFKIKQEAVDEAMTEKQQLREENERIAKEKDELIEVDRQRDRKYHEDGETIDELRSELAAKDKVLKWYEDEGLYDQNEDALTPEILNDCGKQARSILAQYKAVSHET